MTRRMNYGPRFRGYGIAGGKTSGIPMMNRPWEWNHPTPLRKVLNIAKTSAAKHNKTNLTLAGPDMRIKKPPNQRLLAEERMMERIKKAVEILSFGVEELSLASIDEDRKRIDRLLCISLDRLMGIIHELALAAKMPQPQFAAQRKPGARPSTKYCMNCGAHHNELSNRCAQCEEDRKDSKLHEASEERRAKMHMNQLIAQDIKRISQSFRNIQKARAKDKK